MAFIQSCFIKKNTPELRQYLHEIGYKYGGKASKFEQPYLYCSLDKYFECNSFPTRYHGIVDCAENEDLFMALAALRDDTDKHQWIIDEANECFGLGDSMMICDKDDMNDRAIYTHYRKATVDEILKFFK